MRRIMLNFDPPLSREEWVRFEEMAKGYGIARSDMNPCSSYVPFYTSLGKHHRLAIVWVGMPDSDAALMLKLAYQQS